MSDKPLTIVEVVNKFQDNPQAASLAVGMILLQDSREQVNRINKWIEEDQQKQIEKLEAELAFWRPLGKKWLALKELLYDAPMDLD